MITLINNSELLSIAVGVHTLDIHKKTGYLQIDRGMASPAVIITPDEFPNFLQAMRTCMNSHKAANATKERKVEDTEKE